MALDKIKTDIIADDAVTVAKVAADTGITDKYHKVPVYANNAARDHNTTGTGTPAAGMIIFNTADSALQQYTGTAWAAIAPAPTISSTSGTINEDSNTTLTVNGSQFASGMTVKLILASSGADIAGHTSMSYTLVSFAQITVTIPAATTNIAAGTAVQVEIIKSGLTVKSDSITVTEDPNWTTSAGTVATISDSLGTGQTVATLAASAGAGGGTLNYASDDSTLDTTYFALNLTSGVITTHASNALTGITSGGTVTEAFNANAKISGDAAKNVVRAFNIIVNKSPTGGTITTYSGYRVHSFLSGSTTFTLFSATTCDILMVAGGGGGGWDAEGDAGGGGAGGMRVITNASLGAGAYTAVVGAGGQSGSAAANGSDTTFTGQTAAHGGGRGSLTPGASYQPGADGGSGGGGGGENDSSSGQGAGGDNHSTASVASSSSVGNTAGYYGADGGDGNSTTGAGRHGGGGGGAGGVGGAASSSQGGTGGAGLQNLFRTGSATFYAAGGGGGGKSNGSAGGSSIGGTGGDPTDAGTAGTVNTGSGGGGGNNGNTTVAQGGSGIIVVRYAV